jgi:hypothetical protein
MVGQNRESKISVGEFSTPPLHIAKFGRLMQTLARLERQFTDRVALIALRTETLAAFGAPAGKQSAAALGGHARAETVGAGTMQITGIESTFHSATREQKPRAKSRGWAIYERRQGY